jgi:peptidoglycan/LPS O-acetylase OafA/YrhL
MLGSVSFASIDGPAAITLFFVLSDFVLPLGFLRSGRTELVVRATAKRWLRLVCLVMLAVLLSWLLFRFGLYRHRTTQCCGPCTTNSSAASSRSSSR